MAEPTLRRTVAAVEGDAQAVCPECGQLVPGRDRPEHLQRDHGYLEATNMLLARSQALAWLWERTFRGDDEAHERIHTLLVHEGGGPAYTSALEGELTRRAEGLFAARWQEVPRVVQNLRRYALAEPHFR